MIYTFVTIISLIGFS